MPSIPAPRWFRIILFAFVSSFIFFGSNRPENRSPPPPIIPPPSLSSTLTQVVIHSLTRIQNYAIWPFYALTRKAMADRYGGDPNEKLLFHGARVRANMDAITNFGSERRQGCRDGWGI